ncbi:MAG: sulfatase-like hydrolase/transferase [Limisphaerales bacterium]
MKKTLLLTTTALFLLGGIPSTDAAKNSKPNILFIFADDMCYELIREFGHTDIDTPHLDRLVRSGTTFTHAYNMGSWSGAVCVASRTMLNTGRYIWNANAIYRETAKEAEAGRMWSQYMGGAGYQTFMTGKWHVRADTKKIFDVASNVRGGMPKAVPSTYNRPLPGKPDVWSPYDKSLGGFWEGGKHWSEVVADDAVDFMNTARKNDQPFFMYLAFNAVHDPRQVAKDYIDQYPLDRIKVPENFLPEYPYKDDIKNPKTLRDEKLGPFPRTHHAVKVHRQEYYALTTHMDEQIGRILAHLKKTGQDKNTYIFFTADHGLAVGRHGLFGKQNMYDHSLRVPFIAVGPGITKGKQTAEPIYLQDVMPTSLELAGVKKPKQVEFHSLMPMLTGKQEKSHLKSVYGAYLNAQRAIIDDGYKLLLYPDAKVARLYNLKKDPHEMVDLAKRKKSKPLMKKLFAKFLQQQKDLGDKLDVQSVFPDLN